MREGRLLDCGGPPRLDRFLTTPDGEPGLHYLCAGYKRFFRHIDEPMRVMADLLRRDVIRSERHGARTA